MTNYTTLSDSELTEALNFHRRQRNMSRGINEAAHARQTQMVRMLEAEEARRLDELSKKTLGSYVKKASTDQYLKGQAVQYHTNKANDSKGSAFEKESKKKHMNAADAALRKASNRDTGIGRAVDRLTKEEIELDENIAGKFKDASEWEHAAKSRGLVVKSMTHPSGETTKYQIAKDKEGNNRGHFDHGTKSGHLKEEADQIDEISKDTLHSYLKKASKNVDSLSNQRDKVQKDMSKTYSAIAKRSNAENAAHNATTQSQHNKATATYRSATKGANKALGGHGDLVKQHANLTKKSISEWTAWTVHTIKYM